MQGKISADSLTAVIFVVLVSRQVCICILFAYEQRSSDGFSRDRSLSHAQVLHAKRGAQGHLLCLRFERLFAWPGWSMVPAVPVSTEIDWGGAAQVGAKVPLSRHKDVTLHPRGKEGGKALGKESCTRISSQKLDLGHCHFPTLCWTMTTWQRIFAEKAARMKLMDPWVFEEDNSLQVHSLEPGWKEFLQNHVAGR